MAEKEDVYFVGGKSNVAKATPKGGLKVLDKEFSSHYMKPVYLRDSLRVSHHLLDVDMPCFVIADCEQIMFRVTRLDVIHSFALPSLGLKIDAVPGKGNAVTVDTYPGHFFGQCSEICGTGHTVIPISIEIGCKENPVYVKDVEVGFFKPCDCSYCLEVGAKAKGLELEAFKAGHTVRGEYMVNCRVINDFVSHWLGHGFSVKIRGGQVSLNSDGNFEIL